MTTPALPRPKTSLIAAFALSMALSPPSQADRMKFGCLGPEKGIRLRFTGDYDSLSRTLRLQIIQNGAQLDGIQIDVMGTAQLDPEGTLRFDNLGPERDVSGTLDFEGSRTQLHAPGIARMRMGCRWIAHESPPSCSGRLSPRFCRGP